MKRQRPAEKDKETWSKLWPSQHPEKSVPLLQALHILTRDGALNADSRRKLTQVLHLTQLLRPALETLLKERDEPVLADVGAGKSYLGFILYDLVFGPAGRGRVVGVEAREKLVEILARAGGGIGLRAHGVHRRADRRGDDTRRPRRHGDGAACLRHRDRRRHPLRLAP